jgi:hypothetical protein
MLYQLEKLNDGEKELVFNAPAYITILIAGADHDITEGEIKRSLQLVHVKSFAESMDIRDLYKEIDADFEARLHNLMNTLPGDHDAREQAITEALGRLNSIFGKMEEKVAHKYYISLLNFANYIARSAGGILGLDRISFAESKYVKLPMITDPKVG